MCEWYTVLGVVLVAMVYVRKVLGKGGEVDGRNGWTLRKGGLMVWCLEVESSKFEESNPKIEVRSSK